MSFYKRTIDCLEKTKEKKVENKVERTATVDIELSDEEFVVIAKAAHKRDITFNDMVNIMMKEMIARDRIKSAIEEVKEHLCSISNEDFNDLLSEQEKENIEKKDKGILENLVDSVI